MIARYACADARPDLTAGFVARSLGDDLVVLRLRALRPQHRRDSNADTCGVADN